MAEDLLWDLLVCWRRRGTKEFLLTSVTAYYPVISLTWEQEGAGNYAMGVYAKYTHTYIFLENVLRTYPNYSICYCAMNSFRLFILLNIIYT